jgi:hypothetical protein
MACRCTHAWHRDSTPFETSIALNQARAAVIATVGTWFDYRRTKNAEGNFTVQVRTRSTGCPDRVYATKKDWELFFAHDSQKTETVDVRLEYMYERPDFADETPETV